MLKLGTETGSLINHLYSRSAQIDEIAVGVGATILSWSDRRAGTIIEVGANKAGEITEFCVQIDKATRTDTNGMSDAQTYSYEADPNGCTYRIKRVTRGKAKGQWRVGGTKDGQGVLIGKRDKHFDYSF